MKLINPQVELLTQEEGLSGIYKQIERAGRTCYKSEDKITENSAEDFVKRMIESNHTAMLEHGTVYLYTVDWDSNPLRHYWGNKYSKVKEVHLETEHCQSDTSYKYAYYVTTNFRVLVEHGWLYDLNYLCEPTEHHQRRITLKFTTNIGVTREGNRHRVNSIAEESTRYCNYTKEKFGSELNICPPVWMNEQDKEIVAERTETEHLQQLIAALQSADENYLTPAEWYGVSLAVSQHAYKQLIVAGWKPQQAREVLPLATKSDVVYTAFASDWRHWFDLRLFGKTGAPHPNMKHIAELARDILIENNLWGLIYNPDEPEFIGL